VTASVLEKKIRKFETIPTVQAAIDNGAVVQAIDTLWQDVSNDIKTLRKDFAADIGSLAAELKKIAY
jgi:hypothetical protein